MTGICMVVGASSGLGAATAASLAQSGYTVYACARSYVAGKAPPKGCHALAMDVTDEASIAEGVQHVLSAEGHIDSVVYCAAQIVQGPLELLPMEALQSVLDTNFVGAVRVMQAVLPSMRERRNGRIVLFSSINGLLAIPFTGAYIASKHALEGYAETLHMEVRRFGIHVTLLEPGDCSGGSQAYRAKADQARSSPYDRQFRAAARRIETDEAAGMKQERIARAVLSLLKRRKPPVRMMVAPIVQRAGVYLHDLLPTRLYSRLVEAMYCNDKEADE